MNCNFLYLFTLASFVFTKLTFASEINLIDGSKIQYNSSNFEIIDGTQILGSPVLLVSYIKAPKIIATISTEFKPVVFQKRTIQSNWCSSSNIQKNLCIEKINLNGSVNYTLRSKSSHLLKNTIEVIHSLTFSIDTKNIQSINKIDYVSIYKPLLEQINWAKK